MSDTDYKANFIKAAKQLAKDADRRFQGGDTSRVDRLDVIATALTRPETYEIQVGLIGTPTPPTAPQDQFPNDAPDPTSNQPGTFYNGTIWVPSPDPHPFRTMTVSMAAAMEYGMANDGAFNDDELDLAERVATALTEILGPYYDEHPED